MNYIDCILIPIVNGISLGFIVAAPSVSQAVLCLKETLSRGWKYGLISGFGVALADALFSLMAGLGIGAVRNWIESFQGVLHVSGAIIIVLFGISLFFCKPDEQTTTTKDIGSQRKIANAFMPNFLLTILHPVTLFFFTAAFAALPVASGSNKYMAVPFISLGVFLGSMIWWSILIWCVKHFSKNKMTPELLLKIKKIFGIIMLLLGIWLFVNHFS